MLLTHRNSRFPGRVYYPRGYHTYQVHVWYTYDVIPWLSVKILLRYSIYTIYPVHQSIYRRILLPTTRRFLSANKPSSWRAQTFFSPACGINNASHTWSGFLTLVSDPGNLMILNYCKFISYFPTAYGILTLKHCEL